MHINRTALLFATYHLNTFVKSIKAIQWLAAGCGLIRHLAWRELSASTGFGD